MGLSLRTRLTAWYTAGLGTTLLVFGALTNRVVVHRLSREFDERIASAAGAVEFSVREMSRDLGPDIAAERLLYQLRFIEVRVGIVTRSANGAVIVFAGSDAALIAGWSPGPCHSIPIVRRRLGREFYRLLIRCLPLEGTTPELTIIVGASDAELLAASRRIREMIVLALAIGLALTTLGGHWLSGKAIEPIRRMAEQVQRIGSESLKDRLPVTPAHGEIAVLSTMVNELFDRLAATIGRERQFLANAAHALRTPVAVLQNEVSEATLNPELPATAPDALAEIGSLVGHLARTVEYLLSLARRDAGTEAFSIESIYLDDVVSGTAGRLARIAERRNIRLLWGEVSEAPVRVDPHVVEQVTQILLENALQYTPEGGMVTISVGLRNGNGRLLIEDNGPGLEAGDFESLFTPFARGSAARRTGASGSGLGLAVASWMVESCRGAITVEPVQPHGARFVVDFPGVQS